MASLSNASKCNTGTFENVKVIFFANVLSRKFSRVLPELTTEEIVKMYNNLPQKSSQTWMQLWDALEVRQFSRLYYKVWSRTLWLLELTTYKQE